MTEVINSMIRKRYDILDACDTEAIKVNDLADEVYDEMDPRDKAPALVKWAAILQLRQLSRAICRKRQDVDEEEIEGQAHQESLFEYTLQPRYPAVREDEECYVLRKRLTTAERRENVERLRSEAFGKMRHADALEAETETMIKNGELSEDK